MTPSGRPLLASCLRRQPCSRLAPASSRARFLLPSASYARAPASPAGPLLPLSTCSPLVQAGSRARLLLPPAAVLVSCSRRHLYSSPAPAPAPARPLLPTLNSLPSLSSSLSTSSHLQKDCLIAASSVISVYASGMDEINLAAARQMKVYVENLVMGVTVEVHTSQCCRFKIQGQDGVTFMDAAEDTVDLRDDHLLRDVANQIADHFVNTRSGLIRRRSKSIVIEIWSSAPEGVRKKAADIKKALDKCRVAIRLQVRIEHSALRESFSVRDEDGNHFLHYTQYVPPIVMCHFIDVKEVVDSIVTAADNDQY